MDPLLTEMRRSLQLGNYIMALTAALCAIDICAALESEDGRTSGKKFKAWYEENLLEVYPDFAAEDAYQLRCGTLHQGRTASDAYDNVVFSLPGGVGLHNLVMNNTLILNLSEFIDDIGTVIEAWWARSSQTEPVLSNGKHLMRARSEYAPYVRGIPLLA